jgi:glycosyltransferase involved in cell wall biosynthesis
MAPLNRHRAAAGGARTIVVLGGYADSLLNFRGSLLRELVGRGHTVVACAPSASPQVVQALAAMGVSYRDVPFRRAGLRPDQDTRAFRVLVALLREIRPDVILSYTIKPVIYGLLAARLAGVPGRFAMITGLGYAFVGRSARARLVGAVVRRLYRLSLRGADRVFFQNPDDRALFEEFGLLREADQAVIINGSGVELDAFRPAPLPPGPPSFLLIGRLLRDKGVGEYVEAARLLLARYPDVVFRLAGWVDENPSSISERELGEWRAEGVVEFLGRLDDVRPAIAASCAYVLPSYREGTPRTVLEAMAMGRPVVTTDAPGCRETVQDGVNGFLVPVRDAKALAAAMERLIVEPGLMEAMGRESRRIAEERYDVHKVNGVILGTMGLA